ncbi:thioredoxin domain-containing protein [Gordonia sp. ABSL11-1]|uniref:DsbA family protein n=1 Tax=Gordonia sp. ABSL11-1 TaxID=3053924 RepID=UPI0025729D88|nr:thioredoxin domain-containing protein [Gordonia sp. ABSL11-1]MDL9946883.1 thioredoxin domain-containing protein [Gordonia sp. ABSL11-1]
MTRRTRLRSPLAVTVVAIVAIVVAGIVVLLGRDDSPSVTSADGSGAVVRADSHRLTDPPQSRAQFVEFLDFECEACAAVHPLIEELRASYGDQVTFVVRYFPMPGHVNGERAARAVEAAAHQGRFEQMYQRMFSTQSQWGEREEPADGVFRTFAADLGLDMAGFDESYHAPATIERVRADVADGLSLGVQGTPTFFLDGMRLQPTSYDDLVAAIEERLSDA